MGKVLLISRLALKDLRHRPAQALLLLLALAAGAATLSLGLTLRGTTDDPYARTMAATTGPDVVADVQPPGLSGAADAGKLASLEHAPGVVGHSGPFPVTWVLLTTGHTTASAEVEGRSAALSAVDRPELLRGRWLQPGGVVVEAGFADALGLGVGDRIRLGDRTFTVDGIAVTAAFPNYTRLCALGCTLVNAVGNYDPGLIWVSQADVASLANEASEPIEYFLNLKLADPGAAQAFAASHGDSASSTGPYLTSWQAIRAADADALANVELVLLTGSWLLALLALASVVVLVGGRMSEQTRRVGLLKAVGGTPRLVALILLAEHVLVGLAAGVIGLFAGWLAGPFVTGAGAGLIGASSIPSLTGSNVGLVIALAVAVAILATAVPSIRAARQSTVAALDDGARPPRRRAPLVRLSAHLPATLLVGARLAVRRPRRLLLTVFSVAVTASGIVAVLVLHTTTASWSLGPRVTEATTIVSVMLAVLAAVNAVFIAWTTVLEARHPAALARALGATPEQITVGLSVSQLLPALLGALLGIPGGIGIYDAAKSGGATTVPSVLALVLLVVLTVLVLAALIAVPTHVGARRPVAEVLHGKAT